MAVHPDEISDLLAGARRMASALGQIDEAKINQLTKAYNQAKAQMSEAQTKLSKINKDIETETARHDHQLKANAESEKKALTEIRKAHNEEKKKMQAEILEHRTAFLQGMQQMEKELSNRRAVYASEMRALDDRKDAALKAFEEFRSSFLAPASVSFG